MRQETTKLYTTKDAAAMLDRKIGTVRHFAMRHGLGTVVSGLRLLTLADIEVIAGATNGRPRKQRRARKAQQAQPEASA